MRKRLFEIVEVGKDKDFISRFYDIFMIVAIIASLVPLCFKSETKVFEIIDLITVSIFIFDYAARLITADYKLKKGAISFIRYPFTAMAIVDLVSILPSLITINSGLKVLRTARLLKSIKALKALKIFKGFRYSKNIDIIVSVLKKQKDSLITVGVLALGYILISALIIFNVEPETFNSFFDAIYWATVSLTTVGYGDIYPVSTLGKIITMFSAILGIAIVALPAGIITAGYMDEIERRKNNTED